MAQKIDVEEVVEVVKTVKVKDDTSAKILARMIEKG
jgi:hypothetical protein